MTSFTRVLAGTARAAREGYAMRGAGLKVESWIAAREVGIL
jgi:hypothetical protein